MFDQQKAVEEYARRFPDSPVRTLLTKDQELKIFDNRIPGVSCPKCGKEEVVRVNRAGHIVGFCRKCYHEYELPAPEPEIVELKLCEFCKDQDHSNCDGKGCTCDHEVKNVELFKDSEKKRKIRHSFEEDAEHLKALLKEGKTSIQICAEMEISSGTLYDWKKKLGLLQFSREGEGKNKSSPAGKNRREQKPFDIDRFKELYNQGKSDARIAEEMNVSKALPWYHRKKLGLAPNREKNNGKGTETPNTVTDDSSRESSDNTTILEKVPWPEEKPYIFYLELANRFLDYLSVSFKPSFLKFLEKEKERSDYHENDILRALEVCVVMGKLKVRRL